jgi:hypothetical protein
MIRRPIFNMCRMSSVANQFNGSSDALGFGYNSGQGFVLKHRTIRRLDHRFIRRLHLNSTEMCQDFFFSTGWTDAWMVHSAVHPTVCFKSYSTAPSMVPSALDDPTGRRCIASVHCLGFLVQRLYWALWDTRWSDAQQGGTISSSDGTTFSGTFPTASLLCWAYK